jgi:E1A-binding protein p400
MLAENLVEPYKQGQNTPSKPLLTIESKSDEERAEQIPPEINSSAGLESGSPELDEDYDLKSEDETVSFTLSSFNFYFTTYRQLLCITP